MRIHLGISVLYATVPNRGEKNNRVLRVDTRRRPKELANGLSRFHPQSKKQYQDAYRINRMYTYAKRHYDCPNSGGPYVDSYYVRAFATVGLGTLLSSPTYFI